MSARATLGTWVRIAQAEGPAAVRDRLLDRWAEARARSQAAGGAPPAWPAPPVLNVLGVEPAARFGGVPLQALARLRREAEKRPVALLAREPDDALRLEWWHGGRRWARRIAVRRGAFDPIAANPAWLAAVRAARGMVGARGVHLENLAGLSLASVAELADSGVPLVISQHDFGAFCRRPHLWEASGGFCGASTDAARCRVCLDGSAAPGTLDQDAHRALAARCLAQATALVYPSAFLRDRLAALIGWPRDRHVEVVAPGIPMPDAAVRSARRPDRVALLGGAAAHKGGARLERLSAILAARGLAVTSYGGNGRHHLAAMRRVQGVRVRGYYRAGTLPALLARQGAAVSVLLPRVPESFSLAVSEAWAAGVPVVAPAQGALAERLATGGGLVLAPEPTDHEIVEAVEALRTQPSVAIPSPPTDADAAAAMGAIYRRVGLTAS